ncbi:TPA: DUF6650 family protein [Providencia alcalifaciens]|uniref:DUF6650 family protein n=1 Tax=Providencia alcalifaciens TaxID=126385 RepID=UPI0018C66A71|nr:DUF6650 family protein [Providencia alcalifaciens]MBG2883552.1 hypothetical protein [Proteus mirabilis]MDC5878229.1 hypothetical protein [Proteus mirabilis]CAG9426770.1 hypothetical protein NVI2019_NGLDDFDA_02686 [Providencia alcalifaciens]HEJ9692726.1 hypothetical protein [Proteus mirabilis]HEK0687136.1 hypothetical protein [Proteus mirabilis]
MHFNSILRRINGISTPIFGVSWTPDNQEFQAVRKLVTFLEDRRVLYYGEEREGADYCRISVEKIREKLTEFLQEFDTNKDLVKSVRSFRSACRNFCNEIGAINVCNEPLPVQRSILNTELSKLRKVAGKTVGALAISYGLDIEDELAALIPFKVV